MKQLMDKERFAWLSFVGLTFWFLVGFPFGNHNESYYWVSRFQHERAWDVLGADTLAATFRPLGQGLAYVGWDLSGGSSWPVQLFNFAIAAIALRTIALVMTETRAFSVAAAVAVGGFFSGYLYLFHLHGVFYSPVLLVIAALLYLREAKGLTERRVDFAAFAGALATGVLFHPYAIVVYVGYVIGISVEKWTHSSSADRQRRLLFTILAVVALLVMRPGHQTLSNDSFQALMSSYALTEVAPLLMVLSTVLAAWTFLGIGSVKQSLGLGSVLFLVSLALVVLTGAPVILLWICLAILKTAYRREWSLAGMSASAALLPGIAASGSPTYAVFAVLTSTVTLVRGSTGLEGVLERVSARWVPVAFLLICLLAGALRVGVDVPIIGRLAKPLLAEREKTHQLEAVIDWMLRSEYRQWRLTLEDNANPVDAGRGAVERGRRPPTYQSYLDAFLTSQRGADTAHENLLVTFGNQKRDDLMLVKTIPGLFADAALVYR
jgi:hypothetical protein